MILTCKIFFGVCLIQKEMICKKIMIFALFWFWRKCNVNNEDNSWQKLDQAARSIFRISIVIDRTWLLVVCYLISFSPLISLIDFWHVNLCVKNGYWLIFIKESSFNFKSVQTLLTEYRYTRIVFYNNKVCFTNFSLLPACSPFAAGYLLATCQQSIGMAHIQFSLA